MRLAMVSTSSRFLQVRIIDERHRVNADVIVDDEFEPREADAVVRQMRNGKGVVGVADVHHYLRCRAFFVSDDAAVDVKSTLP